MVIIFDNNVQHFNHDPDVGEGGVLFLRSTSCPSLREEEEEEVGIKKGEGG